MSKTIKKYWQRETIAFAILGVAAIAIASMFFVSSPTSAQKKPKPTATPVPALDAPTLSCSSATSTSINLQVTAGASGAPAGFSVQWMTKAGFDANGGVWPTDETTFCKASFSGVPSCSSYNLGPGASVVIQIGDNLFDDCGASSNCANAPLECDTEYVFRAFAHNVPQGANKSDFSAIQTCKTDSCGGGDTGCTFTQGYWKTHGPEGCATGNNTNQWDVTSLMLGTASYTDLELCAIFNTPPAGGNALIQLAHQLIAAKLNIANGADGTAVASAIADADALIGVLVIPPSGTGFLPSSPAINALIGTLDSFNQGTTGPGHCASEILPAQ